MTGVLQEEEICKNIQKSGQCKDKRQRLELFSHRSGNT